MSFAIVVDPDDYDQVEEVEKTKLLVAEFCRRNDISLPPIIDRGFGRGMGRFGFYHRGKIHYNAKKCRKPTKTPGFAWSYTGYKADLTAPGVIAHELGHHVDALYGNHAFWRGAIGHEPVTTTYGGTCTSEDFAESFRLFALNPDLLLEGRPRRYAFFCDILKLEPVVELEWPDVLVFAHEKFFDAAYSFIEKGNR